MPTRVDQVLQITKQIHDTESLLKQLKFELTALVAPERTVTPRHKRRLALKVLHRAPSKPKNTKRATPKNDDQTRAAILEALRKKPLGLHEIRTAIHASMRRVQRICAEMEKEGKIKTRKVEVTGADGRRLSFKKWTTE